MTVGKSVGSTCVPTALAIRVFLAEHSCKEREHLKQSDLGVASDICNVHAAGDDLGDLVALDGPRVHDVASHGNVVALDVSGVRGGDGSGEGEDGGDDGAATHGVVVAVDLSDSGVHVLGDDGDVGR